MNSSEIKLMVMCNYRYMHVTKCNLCVIKIVMGTNKIKQTNDFTLEKY